MSEGFPKPEPVIEPMPEASSEPVTTALPLVSPASKQSRSYTSRFAAAYAILGVIALVALGGFVAFLLAGRSPAGPAWSTWKPKGGARLDMAGSIASHVAPQYRLAPGGDQLVAVQAHNPEIQNIPVEEVALKGATAGTDYKFVPTKDAVVYVLCGLGSRCSIAKGTPSEARARLLRREALELALYTFKYVDGVNSVIALIPPPANDPNTNWALFFQKDNFKPELKKPLSRTLPLPQGRKLVPASVEGNADEQVVEKLTKDHWFTSQFQQLQDGNAILVLDPVIVPR